MKWIFDFQHGGDSPAVEINKIQNKNYTKLGVFRVFF